MPRSQYAENNSCCQNTDTHPFPCCSTNLSAETYDMHCTVDDYRQHFAGFSRKKPAHRTVFVALDQSAAFDNVGHQQQLDCVFNTNIPATIRRWLNNYTQSRQAKVHYRKLESKSRKVETGVVQGGVLSPAFFNYYLADVPMPPPNIKLIKYSDDFTICTSGPVVADLINGLNI